MPIDPDDPPIWLRKLHVTASQIDISDYPATPAEGILQVCRLSDAHRALESAIKCALGQAPSPLLPPFQPLAAPLSSQPSTGQAVLSHSHVKRT